ncbi:helix-turn-helix domain-containing protein [Streptomyces griseorubiginosus]|uniref:helix-turn-helix domain-containing protein n=1 Tax=Streptomyces griseorubiginosus TaxID=67304 RepID=UPI001AD782F7|nr:helix-turn-helix domain-containing protein [Streptomyces griseorubiginosus]MBO4255766.1 helix-turn-helix domain-containing protein [Streptomyces griseorubiginosus]
MTTAVPELLTVPDVMARLKVGRTKVYDLIRTNRLVSLKVDGCRRIPAEAVRDFIRRGTGEAA